MSDTLEKAARDLLENVGGTVGAQTYYKKYFDNLRAALETEVCAACQEHPATVTQPLTGVKYCEGCYWGQAEAV